MVLLNKWLLSLGTLVLFILLSFVAVFILNKLLKLTTKRVSLDSRIAKSLRRPLRLIIILIGIFIANYYIKPDLHIDGFNLITLYKVIFIFVLTYTLVNILKGFFVWYVENLKIKKKTQVDDTIFQFLTRITTVVLYVIAILIALSFLGIEIKPVLAGLGIAGLAVALALQDTLSNFFSAIYIAVDQPVKIGDFIETSTGEKGYVSDIGWRSTRLRTRENNIIIIPNSKLAQSVVTNYYQVQAKFKVEIPVGISYNSDLNKVEKITAEVAKKIMTETSPNIKDFEPYIRYEAFGDSSINFKVSLMVDDVENKYLLNHKFIKELMKEYRKNKIEIPYPQRDIHIKKL
ncbi:mechanosensitive ion channel family protein [Candidatus Woesearchaeota archaeon]|nr:mechanosensitive ion channel family protein [Candidatus Woesearchaeota archaeon]